jgi:ABC-type Co2+ transport system permease subunit
MEHSKYETKTHTSYNNSLIESRFKVFLFLLRMGGIPINMKSVSRINAVYNASLFWGFYITNILVGVDLFVHRNQLSLAMKIFRQYLGMLMVTWLHFCVR